MDQPDPPALLDGDQTLQPPGQPREQRCMGERSQDGPGALAGGSRRRTGARKRRRGGAFGFPVFAAALVACVAGVGAVSVPEAPARVDLDVMSGDEVVVAFSAPLSDGGSTVQSYEVCTR